MSEIEEVRRRYLAGEYEHIRTDLDKFIGSHREKILKFKADYNAREPRRKLDDALAIKFYLLRVRSINPKQEIKEQLEEIEKEKWIRGVNLGHAPDPHQVAVDWARLYSPAWRANRVTTIIFVFEQERERYTELLK